MTTFGLSRGISSGVKLILQATLHRFHLKQCYQPLSTISHLGPVSGNDISINQLRNSHQHDPFTIIQEDIQDTFRNIKKVLKSPDKHLNEIIQLYFDGESKIRPAIIILMAKALNNHVHGCESILLPKQREVAMTAEMLHTAGGFHELTSTSEGSKHVHDNLTPAGGKAVIVGDYILSNATLLLARIGNNEVYGLSSKILADQVQGDFMQSISPSIENKDERFSRYLMTSYKKTGSLIANSCKAVAIFAGADSKLQELAFHYGKNVGITLQLADDDSKGACFHGNENTTYDPDIWSQSASNPMCLTTVTNDDIENRRILARQHCAEAGSLLQVIQDSPEKRALLAFTKGFLKNK